MFAEDKQELKKLASQIDKAMRDVVDIYDRQLAADGDHLYALVEEGRGEQYSYNYKLDDFFEIHYQGIQWSINDLRRTIEDRAYAYPPYHNHLIELFDACEITKRY